MLLESFVYSVFDLLSVLGQLFQENEIVGHIYIGVHLLVGNKRCI